MTGDRKWEAIHRKLGDGKWAVVETVQSSPNFFNHRHVAIGLTETEARDIALAEKRFADFVRIKAERDEAVKLLVEWCNNAPGSVIRPRTRAFRASIKEQGDG